MTTQRARPQGVTAADCEPRRACVAQTQHGEPCRSFALPEGTLCAVHDPARRERVQAARSKGGQMRAIQGRRRKLDTAQELLKFTSTVILDVLEGSVNLDVGRVVLYGVQVQRGVLETATLADRIDAIEQQVALQPRAARGGRW